VSTQFCGNGTNDPVRTVRFLLVDGTAKFDVAVLASGANGGTGLDHEVSLVVVVVTIAGDGPKGTILVLIVTAAFHGEEATFLVDHLPDVLIRFLYSILNGFFILGFDIFH
jgi:hypothetical protein